MVRNIISYKFNLNICECCVISSLEACYYCYIPRVVILNVSHFLLTINTTKYFNVLQKKNLAYLFSGEVGECGVDIRV